MSEVVAAEQKYVSSSEEELTIPRPRKKARTASYLSVAELMDIFPEETPGTLAMLSEAHESLPSEILDLVPHITSVQLADYGELVKKHQAARDFKPKVLDSTELLKAIEKEAARHVYFSLDRMKRKWFIDNIVPTKISCLMK